MALSLIGMSGSGKSYWSRRLQRHLGFQRFGCDDIIEERLAPKLQSYTARDRVAEWMGQPFDEQFPAHQKEYLDLEVAVMRDIFEEVGTYSERKRQATVIDTTGSVIYTGEEICHTLKERSSVIYLEVSEEVTDHMFERYRANPRPVVFHETPQRKEGESEQAALERAYRDLISYRRTLYEHYADITIPYEMHRNANLRTEDFLELVSRQ